MAYACVQDIASSWSNYERVAKSLLEPTPIGLIAHVAGPTDEGVRIIEIWDSEEEWEQFRADRLAATIATLETVQRPTPTLRALTTRHVHLRPAA